MSKTLQTALTEAKTGIDVCAAELRQAHSLACHDDADQFAEIVLLDLVGQAAALQTKISRALDAATIAKR